MHSDIFDKVLTVLQQFSYNDINFGRENLVNESVQIIINKLRTDVFICQTFCQNLHYTLSPNAVTNKFSHYMVTTSHFKPTTD